MTYTTLFFDLDHTLWDFEQNSKISLEINFRRFRLEGLFADFEQFYSLYHQKNKELWALYRKNTISKEFLTKERFLFPLREVGAEDEALAIRFGEKYLDELAKQTNLIEGCVETLEYVKRKYRLYILSNGFREVQFEKLKNADILRFFDGVVLSDDIGVNKPDVRLFRHALRTAKCERRACAFVGDDWEADIVGAKNAGIDQIFFNPNETPTPFAATYEIKKLTEIKQIL